MRRTPPLVVPGTSGSSSGAGLGRPWQPCAVLAAVLHISDTRIPWSLTTVRALQRVEPSGRDGAGPGRLKSKRLGGDRDPALRVFFRGLARL